MDINSLTAQFKSYDELKVFCQSQHKQVILLSKKIKELEEKNSELNKKVKENNKLQVISNNNEVSINPSLIVKDDAKTIAEIQLKMIKDISFDRELTLEEAKKVDLYHKILNTQEIEEKPKTFKVDARSLKDDELLALVKGDKK